MLKKSKSFEFYEIQRTIKAYPNAHYYVVYGERSNGKTYSALNYALERWAKAGEEFAYIRRYAEDIRPKNLSSLFSGHVDNGVISRLTDGRWDGISYGSARFYLNHTDEKGNTWKNDSPIGYAFDINSMEHNKSLSYPKVTTIIFDEFLSRSGYLPNEFILFTNLISTIVRHRDNVKIIMLGNTVNKTCPYFAEMGLSHVKDQKQDTVDVYHYADSGLEVVCEYTESAKKKGGKASDVYFAFDNPELKMITSGAWEIAIYPHLTEGYEKADVVMDFFIEFEDELLHGEIVSSDSGPYVFIHEKTTPIQDEDNDIIYTDKPDIRWNHMMCMTKQCDKYSLFIMQAMRENKIFYSTNEVGEIVRNYVLWSDSFSIKN